MYGRGYLYLMYVIKNCLCMSRCIDVSSFVKYLACVIEQKRGSDGSQKCLSIHTSFSPCIKVTMKLEVLVRNKRYLQSMTSHKCTVRFLGIFADAYDLCVCFLKLRKKIGKLFGLYSTSGRIIFGVEIDDSKWSLRDKLLE